MTRIGSSVVETPFVPAPVQPPELTGKHLCTRCLRETGREEYMCNDHVCDECAGKPSIHAGGNQYGWCPADTMREKGE